MVVGETMDQERRIRREIANSNERRRMQSINAGFQSLRTLLPHHEGEKLSKVCNDHDINLESKITFISLVTNATFVTNEVYISSWV